MTLPAIDGNVFHRRVLANVAPLHVFRRLYAGDAHAFLYESLEGRGTSGQYSFLGGKPTFIFKSTGRRIESGPVDRLTVTEGDPIVGLRSCLQSQRDAPPIATFPGGAVGYFSYDTVRFFESLPDGNVADPAHPDAYFLFPGEIIIVDHLHEVAHILLYGQHDSSRRADAIAEIIAESEKVACGNDRDQGDVPSAHPAESPVPLRPNMTRQQFMAAVMAAKDYIAAGDVFQVVLSQRFEFPVTMKPIHLYNSLRTTNPSPYMYFLQLDGLNVLGSSPEVLVKLNGRRVVSRPLAGTRRRGKTAEEDQNLAHELRNDEKERAEHVMLVDLARNDIGRVCMPGSVKVTRLLDIERYAQVMHLVSDVEGRLRDERDAFDLLAATFPAGTVSGAPKIRAMEIIDELETCRRGIYAGAIGYISYLGDMDMCIAIRTVIMDRDRGFIQAGAGIVADSDPQKEYEETMNKAGGLFQAVQRAMTNQD